MRSRILFVGAGDAGRSRMAAAFLDHLAGDRYEAVLAGVDPGEDLQPEVVAAMADERIFLGDGPSTPFTPELSASARRVIGIGDASGSVAAACPPSVPVDVWDLPDPRGRPPGEVRVIRDVTRRLVERLIALLDAETPRG